MGRFRNALLAAALVGTTLGGCASVAANRDRPRDGYVNTICTPEAVNPHEFTCRTDSGQMIIATPDRFTHRSRHMYNDMLSDYRRAIPELLRHAERHESIGVKGYYHVWSGVLELYEIDFGAEGSIRITL